MSNKFLAAKKGDKLMHTSFWADFVSGVVKGAIYAAIGTAVAAATVFTGGAALAVGIAAGAAAGFVLDEAVSEVADAIGEFIGGKSADGTIVTGSKDVKTKGIEAARAAGSIPNSVIISELLAEKANPPNNEPKALGILKRTAERAAMLTPAYWAVKGPSMLSNLFNSPPAEPEPPVEPNTPKPIPSPKQGFWEGMLSPVVAQKHPYAEPRDKDKITCEKYHVFSDDGLYLAEGSKTVLINSQPASRNGDRSTCEAVIEHEQTGAKVRIGGPSVVVRDIKSGKNPFANFIGEVVGGLGVGLLASGVRNLLRNGLRNACKEMACIFAAEMMGGAMGAVIGSGAGALASRAFSSGHPIHYASGSKILAGNDELDFVISGRHSIRWQRMYSSRNRFEGALGMGWRLPFETHIELRQSVIHPEEDELFYYDLSGRELSLGSIAPGHHIFYKDEGFTLHRTEKDQYMIISDIGHVELYAFADEPKRLLRLLSRFDQHGNPQCYHRDSKGRVIAIDDGTAAWGIDIIYHSTLSRIIEIKQRMPNGAPAKICVRYSYDEHGHLATVEDADGIEMRHFTYHPEHGKMTSHRTATGLLATYDWALLSDQYYVIRHRLLEEDRILEQLELTYDLTERTLIVDELGVGRSYRQWDELYQITYYRNALDESCSFIWGDPNKLTQFIDQNGNVSEFAYDDRGNLVKTCSPMGEVTLTDWDDEYALPTVVVFPNGATWRYEYNDHCSLTKIIGPLGEITQYVYADNGDCIAILDAMGNQVHYHYDEQGQLIKHLDCSGHMTRFFYHPDGQIDTVINAENINTSYEFSDAGRLQRIIQPNERVQQYHYNTKGQLISVKYPDGNQTDWQLNARGQITEITQANGQRIKYEYDGLGRLLTLINQLDKRYQFSYDAVGRLLEEVDLIGQRKIYQYNKAGNLIAHTAIPAADEYGSEPIAETYEHDALGRVIIHHTQTYQTHYHYQYDTVEIVRYTQAEQHRAQSTQTEAVPLDTLTFNYDQYGRLIEEINHAGSFKNQYDLLSNLTQTLLPDGASFDYFYYGTGHLLETQFNRGETRKIIAEYTRDKLHREISRSQGVLQQHIKYDAFGRITNKSVFKNDHHPAYFALLEKRFTYNTRDELIGKQINRGSPEKTLSWASQYHEYYNYDAVGQCISRLGDPQLGEVYYDYDEAGNHYEHYRWTVQSNQLQEFRGKHYKYDGFGRLRAIIHGGSIEKAFEYDCQNQMIASLNNSSSIIKAQYEYDALGRRIKKLVHKTPKREYTLEGEESKTQLFFWQGLRMVGETTEEHLENRRWYAYNEGSYEPIAFIDHWDIVKRDEVYYYHTNINGAPEELTSESGEFTWQGQFSLFGKRYREQNNGHTLYGQPLCFQGQYLDEETGMHYNTFRYYDPETGRFTQQDPIGLAGSINLYQYAQNPLVWVDPLGWAPWKRGRFNQWFNSASSKDILDNKKSVEKALRAQGGMHEKFPVAIAWKARELGFTAQELKSMTIPTKSITFTGVIDKGIQIPDGAHHSSSASTFFHSQLMDQLLNSNSKNAAIEIIEDFHQKHVVNYQSLNGGCN